MEKLMKMLEQLMPLLAFYPPWVKAFFAVSIAFLLASLFMFVVLYPSASKRKNEQSAKSEISVDISVMPGGDTGNQSTTPPASTQSRTPEPGVGNQSTANADNQSTKPEANTGDQSTSRPAADTVNLPPRPGGATDIQPMTPADGRGNQSTSRRDLSRDLTTLTYSVESTDQQIKIRPQMPYLSILANGGPIEDNGYFRSPFEVSLPNLDIKIVNNSNKTIFLTRALFEVEDSTPDTSPVFIVHAGYNSHFTIVNEGWGKVSNCLIKFNVIPFTEETRARRDQLALSEGPYKNEIRLGEFSEWIDVDVSKAISDSGANLERIAELRMVSSDGSSVTFIEKGHEVILARDVYKKEWEKAVGPFLHGEALLYGKIITSADPSAQIHKIREIKFSTPVHLHNNIALGAPRPPTYQYNLALEIDRRNYVVQVPLSQVLKPGEADRFNIRVSVQKSSVHKFRVKFVHNGGEILSPPIDLQVFIPRSSVKFLESAKEGITGKPDEKENEKGKPSTTLGWPPSQQ